MNSSDNNLSEDFFIPCLKESIRYSRGVGYFSSGWLRINAKGLISFADNGGRARWIVSPILSESDWDALVTGEEAKANLLLKEALEKVIQDFEVSIQEDTLNALAWMVADEIVEFRLATVRGKLRGEFHDKFGIFQDEDGNCLSFNGSNNESIQGSFNYESFKVFRTWDPHLADFAWDDKSRFEKLWKNDDPNLRILKLDQSIIEKIVKLRTSQRPYQRPSWVREKQPIYMRRFEGPKIPEFIQLRDYQLEAINEWAKNGFQGFLEMATGTGKTITSLGALCKLFEKKERLAIVITVPYKHLVIQWEEDLQNFNLRPILAFENRNKWLNPLNESILEYNKGFSKFFSVITTHTTFSSPHFQETISRLEQPSLIIADEAHHLGSETGRQSYPLNIPARLALSATPNRWFDTEGTEALRSYFGKTVFEFTLGQAIGVSLTKYYYHPHLVELTAEELELYEEFTLKIAKIYARAKKDQKAGERLKMLLIKRSNLLNKAENKISVLSELIDENPVNAHTLFYCAPGQLKDVLKLVGIEKRTLIHKFTNEEDSETRKKLLQQFADEEIQALAAIKCLDEGVDVPKTKVAYLLASSSNPREFIQRRGRVLRKAPGKKHSIIHDLITVPPSGWSHSKDESVFNVERGILKKELSRFKEFAAYAQNKHQATDVIWEMAKRYNLIDF